jgi:hypothetical protein
MQRDIHSLANRHIAAESSPSPAFFTVSLKSRTGIENIRVPIRDLSAGVRRTGSQQTVELFAVALHSNRIFRTFGCRLEGKDLTCSIS